MNKVALLIPHYNNPNGLLKSLDSIKPTENIDVIVVDDGSAIQKIDEKAVNTSFTARGTITYLYLKKNLGIEYALNHGLIYIINRKQYEFIARLDCGDTCIGNRFQQQEKFLNENPEIKLVGSNCIAVDKEKKILYTSVFPEKSEEIKRKMYVNCMFLHPSVMFSVEVIEVIGMYPTNYKAAEDYAFFFNITKKFKTANLQEFLLQYEINPTGISLSKRRIQVWSRIRIIRNNFRFGFWPIYGLVRNFILFLLPYSIILKIKVFLK